jgi:hypothetical protein
VELIAHLAEFDARRLHLGAGYSSLFAYCTQVLRLSEHEAYNRIEAARAARKFPVILDRLAKGEVNLTTVRLLAPHLTEENHGSLLAGAGGRSKRQVEEVLAERFPSPDVASRVRKLPARTTVLDTIGSPTSSGTPFDASRPEARNAAAVPPCPFPSGPASRPSGPRRAVERPLATDRYEIRFTVNGATREKLRLAQDLLRHAVPNGDTAEIFDQALGALLEKLAKEKLAQTSRPRPPRKSSRVASYPGRGQARGLAPRRRTVRLRCEERAKVLRARLSRVS